MSRPRKDGQYLNVRIESDIYRELENVSELAGQTKTMVVERALAAYFDDFHNKEEILRKAAGDMENKKE